MLAGVPGVKPDRMIRLYVAHTVGRPAKSFFNDEHLKLVTDAAAELQNQPNPHGPHRLAHLSPSGSLPAHRSS